MFLLCTCIVIFTTKVRILTQAIPRPLSLENREYVIHMSSINVNLLPGETFSVNFSMDGNTDQNVFGMSCSETLYDINPYWFVKFDEAIQVYGVNIWVRNDCCHYRFHNVTIKVGSNMDSTWPHLTDGQLCYWFPGQASHIQNDFNFTCDSPPLNGRFVVIQIHDEMATNSILSLCEVQIIIDPLQEETTTDLPTSTERSTGLTSPLSLTSVMTHSAPRSTQFHTQTTTSDEFCMCHCPVNLQNSSDINEKLDKIRKELTLNKKILNSHHRRLISARDDRTFSKAAGFVAACVLCTVVGLIIVCDVTNLLKDTRRMYTIKSI